MEKKYFTTGIDRLGNRFKIYTEQPFDCNGLKGTIWKVTKNGKRKKLATFCYTRR